MNASDSNTPIESSAATTQSGTSVHRVTQQPPHSPEHPRRDNFSQDFRRFFVRGLAALMPTLITLWLLIKVWDFLWGSLGIYIIVGLRKLAAMGSMRGWMEHRPGIAVDTRAAQHQLAGALCERANVQGLQRDHRLPLGATLVDRFQSASKLRSKRATTALSRMIIRSLS